MRHRAESTDTDPGARRRVRLGVGAAVVLLLAAFVVAVLSAGLAQGGTEVSIPSARPTAVPSGGPTDADGPTELFVHVSGAVVAPGLVTLPAGSRVVDAIAAAGGLTGEADPGGVNLARPVADGEQLIVPREGEVAAPAAGAGEAAVGGVVNLNSAGQAELESLPRIGPALAQRILDWREANGRFAEPSELLQVAGIGQKVFDGLKDRVVV